MKHFLPDYLFQNAVSECMYLCLIMEQT